MEKLVFKNHILNIVVGGILVLVAFLGYFLGWFEDFLPYFIGAILLLLSVKRFVFTFKKVVSKYATLILIIEMILDVAFVALMIYFDDRVDLFMGLIIYTRGVSYLIINYVTTRKVDLTQYIFNIGYVTVGAFFMFAQISSVDIMVYALSFLSLVIGAIFLQKGIVTLVNKEKVEELQEKLNETQMKNLKKKHKEEEKELREAQKTSEEIEDIKKQIKEVEKDIKPVLKEATKPEPKKEVTKEPKDDLSSKTVVQLKELAKEKGLTGYSSMTKAELIDVLKK